MKSRLFAAVSMSALMLGASAWASTPTPEAASAAVQAAPAPIVVPPLGFVERTLPNGLRVFTARDTSTSNVTVHVWYKVGAKDDPEGRSGFAHMFEHLM